MTNKNQTLKDIIREWSIKKAYFLLSDREIISLKSHLAPKVLLKEEIDWGEMEKIIQRIFNTGMLIQTPKGDLTKWREAKINIFQEALTDIKKLLGVKE